MNLPLNSKTLIKCSAGGIVLNKNGEIALVSQQKNGKVISWSFPKGGIHKGEEKLAAAIREIQEEIGINQLELVSNLGEIKRDKILLEDEEFFMIKIISMFLFKTDQEKLQPMDLDNPDALWFKMDAVATRLTHEKDREFFLSVENQVRKFL